MLKLFNGQNKWIYPHIQHNTNFRSDTTYLKLLKKPKGILINFKCANIFKEGQRTFVTEHFRALALE